MNFSKVEKFLSKPRLGRFEVACQDNTENAWLAYASNLRVSRAFYPRLHLFEVFLRNAIDTALALHFCDSEWVINQTSGFMANTSLEKSKFFLKNEAERAYKRALPGGASAGKVIAELNFGFWTALFLPHHFSLLSGCLLQCFPYKPKHIDRKKVSVALDRIRDFRNRVYHNEPICFQDGSIRYTNAQDLEKMIEEVSAWMDPDLTSIIQQFPVEYT